MNIETIAKSIVLVDDDPMEKTLLGKYLKRSQVDNPLIYFEDSGEFIRFIEEIKQKEERPPAVILLDLNMPEMTGHECLVKIRSFEYFKTTPIIIMFSNSTCKDDIDQSFEKGANDYAVKPKNVKEFGRFLNTIRPLISNGRLND